MIKPVWVYRRETRFPLRKSYSLVLETKGGDLIAVFNEIASAEEYAQCCKAGLDAAREINPENPIRAAEKMVEAIKALKKIADWEFDIMGDCVAEARQIARRAFLDATDRE